MPTSSDCSQLQSIMPLNANVWLAGATKQSKCGNAGGVARTEIGKQDAALLHHRIGFLFDVGAEIAVVRLGRGLQAFAIDVKQPAMEGATQSAIFEAPVGKVGAAMRTAAADLAYGRLENGGLRCAFQAGCLTSTAMAGDPQRPNEAQSLLQRRTKSYPVVEKSSGLLACWSGAPPALPRFDCFVARASHGVRVQGHDRLQLAAIARGGHRSVHT